MYKISKSVIIKKGYEVVNLKNRLLDGEVEITEPYIQELEKIIETGTETIQSDLEKFLFEHKYLVEDRIAESEIQQLLVMMKETLIIGILPTMSCNFRCTYCYECHTSEHMTEMTLENIKYFLKREITTKNIRYVQVNWFGGEPTLCVEQICDFNRYVISLQEQYKFSFISGITTNGYLLDKEMFAKFYRLGIENYQITLDGWQHDTFRKHVTGKKTRDKIVNNLKEISSLPEEYEFVVRLRYNISENNQDMSWYDYIKEVFGADNRFTMYINFVKDWGGESAKNMELCTNQEMNDLEEKHVSYMEKIGLRNDNTREEILIPLKNVCYTAYPNSYTFTPDNRVIKCTVALDDSENQIGRVDDVLGVIVDKEKEEKWTETTLEYCGDCEYILSCLHRACPRQVVIDHQPVERCVLHH